MKYYTSKIESKYIPCTRNEVKKHVNVCKKKCSHIETCKDYFLFVQPEELSLEPAIN